MSNADNRRDLSLVPKLRAETDETSDKVRRLRHEDGRVEREVPAGAAGPVVDREAGFIPDGRDDQEALDRSTPLTNFTSGATEAGPAILALPQRRRVSSWGGIVSFMLCVVMPTIVAAIYYLGFASDQYVVKWQFTIRNAQTSTSAAAAAASSAMTSLLGGSGTTTGPDDYVVTQYIMSEQAVSDLDDRIGLRQLYARPSIDYWSRFDASRPKEQFIRYWENMVKANYDLITGTGLVEVRAFSADDAYTIGRTLVELSDKVVNESALRPLKEAVKYAEAEVGRAEARLKKVRADLFEYRNQAAVIDPTTSVVLSEAAVAQTLRQTLAQYQANLATAVHNGLGEKSAVVSNTRNLIKGTQDQLKDVESEIQKSTLKDQSLAKIVGRYEEINLDVQFAQNWVVATQQSLEQAKAAASAQQMFVIPFVHPAKPQSPTYPSRVVAIATVAGACLLMWTIALLLGRSIREHLA